jgi:hypothetical protein
MQHEEELAKSQIYEELQVFWTDKRMAVWFSFFLHQSKTEKASLVISFFSLFPFNIIIYG